MYLPPDTRIMRSIKEEGVRVIDPGHGFGCSIGLNGGEEIILRGVSSQLIRQEADFIAYAINFYRAALLLDGTKG